MIIKNILNFPKRYSTSIFSLTGIVCLWLFLNYIKVRLNFLRSLTLIYYQIYKPTVLIPDYGNIKIVNSVSRQCNTKLYPVEKKLSNNCVILKETNLYKQAVI